jgi:DNA repair protein RecN (Recombination protein N)
VFEPTPDNQVFAVLSEADRAPEDGRILLTRKMWATGKSRFYLNDRPVSLSLVRNLGDHLVDFHGQHTHQLLLKPREHLLFLDAYSGLDDLREDVRSLWEEEEAVSRRLTELRAQNRTSRERRELLTYQIRELEGLGLRKGEEEELRRELTMLESAERLKERAAQISLSLYDADDSVVERLRRVGALLQDMNTLGADAESECESVASAIYSLEDVARKVEGIAHKIDDAPDRLEALRERVSALQKLRRKHGVDDLHALLEDLRSERGTLATLDETIAEAESTRADVLRRLKPLALELSAKRRRAAGGFSRQVEGELTDLAMGKARLDVSFTPLPEDEAWDDAYPGDGLGLETAEFLLAANPGEGPRPLTRVASGGEISRIMLAIKAAMQKDRVETLVFDEIDAGIGGETAALVGQKLSGVASRTQVLCVTHLARIASLADRHYHVTKDVQGGRTMTNVCCLSTKERVEELARMLGGDATPTGLAHARELMADANARRGG